MYSAANSLIPVRRSLPFDAGLVCKIADQFEEFDTAFRLVYEKYRSIGLIEPNSFERRVLRHHLCPGTNVFLATQWGEPVCTTTLISDSPAGLPIEQLYPREIERKRRAGLSLAEVSCLAGTANATKRSFHRMFMRLMRILGQHSRRFGIDQLVVAVHPKHAPYYERTMAFQQFGNLVPYRGLQNAPAVAIFLDFNHADSVRPPAYDLIFGETLPLMDLLPRPITPVFAEHFAKMVETQEQYVPLTF